MKMMRTRREFVAGASAIGAAALIGGAPALAEEAPPETATVRLVKSPGGTCLAPIFVIDELLRAEGFSDIRYVPATGGFTSPQMMGRNEVDFGMSFAGTPVYHLDAGLAITVVGGVHSGCYELFAHDPIRTISDLKGKRVGIQTLASSAHLYLAIMAKHVGLDPHKDFEWVTSDAGNPMELFAEGKVDAFLGFPPEPQELRGRNVGRVILQTATDRPWSQYLCCMLVANREFVRAYPAATKRVLRAVLKGADFCAADPERAAQILVDTGLTARYDYALQALREIPYTRWRDYDAEDTLRFYALQLREAGMIKSDPNELIAAGTNWQYFEELKHELKA